MRKVKTYEDFVNEEINLRKGLMGAALGASLMSGITSCDNTINLSSGDKEIKNTNRNFILSDYEIQQSINNEYKNRSQSFKIPFTIKNLPKDIDVKFYDPNTNEEVSYFTVYYMLNDDYFKQQGLVTDYYGKTMNDLSKEKIDSLTKLNFKKVKEQIFKNGEPNCVIDFNNFKVELNNIRKKLTISDSFKTLLYLEDNQINLIDKYRSMNISMSDYYFTLLNSEGETISGLVPAVYASKVEVIYTKK